MSDQAYLHSMTPSQKQKQSKAKQKYSAVPLAKDAPVVVFLLAALAVQLGEVSAKRLHSFGVGVATQILQVAMKAVSCLIGSHLLSSVSSAAAMETLHCELKMGQQGSHSLPEIHKVLSI